ncbi:MAG TPA: hypothetical protein VEA19_04725 [Actinomycetota bacterium]|nr:hypothetical protein [Actinomycetota bacterium]
MEIDTRRASLERLIDDAGLFPPASLSMEEATRLHLENRNGPLGWMLGRFLAPASRLEELAPYVPDPDESGPWRISAVLDGASSDPARLADDLSRVAGFSKRAEGRALVELVEVRVASAPDVDEVVDAVARAGVGTPVAPFIEVPHDADLSAPLEAIAEARARCSNEDPCAPPGAKIRCGGTDEGATPSPTRVADFIARCRELAIPFKATAGLHHPIRHVDPATGQIQHGFVNLIGASALALDDVLTREELQSVISEEDPASFGFEPDALRWHDHHAAAASVHAARRDLFVAYGSCSFTEPTDDLRELGLLPA